MKTIVTNGCFDGFHYGHLKILQEARKLGDKLIVLIDNDDMIRRTKGEGRRLMPLNERMEVLFALSNDALRMKFLFRALNIFFSFTAML